MRILCMHSVKKRSRWLLASQSVDFHRCKSRGPFGSIGTPNSQPDVERPPSQREGISPSEHHIGGDRPDGNPRPAPCLHRHIWLFIYL
jgi:hypothetical protein